VTLHPGEGTLEARLAPAPSTCHHGLVRASAVVFLVDVVAGLQVDTDPDRWADRPAGLGRGVVGHPRHRGADA
jgi:hypothetical protein